jgi:hypothetical protein
MSRQNRSNRLLNAIGLLSFLATAGGALYWTQLRPWHQRWGATDDEVNRPLRGDEFVANPPINVTHAITVNATPAEIWPWLVQLGQGRGGFYSYDELENLMGLDIHTANRILPEHQNLQVGDLIPLAPNDFGIPVAILERERAMVLHGDTRLPGGGAPPVKPGEVLAVSWGFYLFPEEDGTTRLVERWRADWTPTLVNNLAYSGFLEPGAFIMERKMLLTLKQRAETTPIVCGRLIDQILPEYEFRGVTSTVIHASPAQIFKAFRELSLADMPVADWLINLRYIPGWLLGKVEEPSDRTVPISQSMADGGNILLGETPDQEVVVGVIGKFHNMLDQEPVSLNTPEEFAQFDNPAYQKLVMSWYIAGGDEEKGYRFVMENRTHALSPAARRGFALYWWLMIKWGSDIMSRILVNAIKRRAEGERGGVQVWSMVQGNGTKDR